MTEVVNEVNNDNEKQQAEYYDDNGSEKESSLSVVDAVLVSEDEYEFADVRKQILALISESEDKTWELSVILTEAYNEGMYVAWGFSSWTDYADQELGISKRKAQYLVQLQEWFNSMPNNVQKWIKKLGWTKARRLMSVVTPENSSEWKKLVSGKTVREIEDIIKGRKKEEKDEELAEGGEPKEVEDKPVNMSFKVFELQKENVTKALQKASEVSGSDKPGNNLDLICTEYLATNAGIKSTHDFLLKIERDLGIRLIAFDISSEKFIYGEDFIKEIDEEEVNNG